MADKGSTEDMVGRMALHTELNKRRWAMKGEPHDFICVYIYILYVYLFKCMS